MEKTDNPVYFAYGSNMDAEQMRARCPDSVLVGSARLPGYCFIINSRGVATVVANPSGVVHGVIWNTSEADRACLDRYEGVKWGTYTREYLQAETEDGKTLDVLVYVAADSESGEPREEYMEGIVAAAERHGLPGQCVEELKSWIRY